MSKQKILVIDDDKEFAASTVRALGNQLGEEFHIDQAHEQDQTLHYLKNHRPLAILLDLSLDSELGIESGFSLLSEIRKHDKTIKVLVLTGHGSLDNGIRALQGGASSFLEKPPNIAHLSALLRDAVSQSHIQRAYEELREGSDARSIDDVIIGESKVITKVKNQLLFLSKFPQNVLIVGESGTEKSKYAKIIHSLSKRGENPFVHYMPSFTTTSLQSSELFGHIIGAFDGATQERKGLFEQAAGGTLFLDEIQDIPQDIQVSLVKSLKNKVYTKHGSSEETPLLFRLISSINSDPKAAIEEEKIRQDFYDRLSDEIVVVPPLRERREDIPALATHYLANIQQEYGLCVFDISDSALDKLHSHTFQGNMRELEKVVNSAALKADFDGCSEISVDNIRLESDSSKDIFLGTLEEQTKAFQDALITKSLEAHDGNRTQTAKTLGITRRWLQKRIEKLN